MKYVVIFAIIVLVVRLDYWIELFEGTSEQIFQSSPTIETSDIKSDREVISLTEDKSLKPDPRITLLALLDDFRTFPDPAVRKRAMEFLKNDPKIFGAKLDKELEARVYRWRDLLINNDPEVVHFLMDLQNVLRGENLAMIKRFFSLWMEIDMENFIKAYSLTKDTNCMIATLFGFDIPEDEKLNEYYARVDSLKALLSKEGLTSAQRSLANSCVMVLNIQISKMSPEVMP